MRDLAMFYVNPGTGLLEASRPYPVYYPPWSVSGRVGTGVWGVSGRCLGGVWRLYEAV